MACVRGWGLGVVVGAIACGPVAGAPESEGGPTRGDDSDGGTSGAPSSSSDDAADDAVDVTTVGGDETTGEPSASWCGASDPSQPLALLSSAESTAVLRGDGSVLLLELPDPMAPVDAAVYPAFAARGDRIAIVWTWSVLGQSVTYGSHLAVLSAAGELSWEHEEPDASMSAPQIGDDGSMVLQRTPSGAVSEGVLLPGPGAQEIVLPDFFPSGPLGVDGWMRGYLATPQGSSVPGWMSTDVEWQGLRASPLATWHARADGSYVYLAAANATPALVIDTPADAVDVPLPMLVGVDQSALYVGSSPDAEWLLVHENEGRWWRVSVADGTTVELVLDPPEGAMPLECYQAAAVIDDAGRVLLSTRDASSAAVLRFDPAGASWSPMGERVTNVDDMNAMIFGETALVYSSGSGETFCPPQTYEPGDAPLTGTTQQLVRPPDGISRLVPTESWASPDPTGVCAALVNADGVTLIDLVTQQELVIPDWQLATWWGR